MTACNRLAWLTVAVCLLCCGCGTQNDSSGYSGGYGNYDDLESITFQDDAQSNSTLDAGLTGMALTNAEGEAVALKDFIGKKNLVFVVVRGATGPVCPFCSTQVSQLISNYSDIAERNAEVVVAYPVEKPEDQQQLEKFLTVTRQKLSSTKREVPFPILIDLELKAVDQLGIRKDLSKPATYILDTDGQVRFAYVGSSLADRPSIQSILQQLDALN